MTSKTQRRIAYRQNIGDYLLELRALTGQHVEEHALSRLEEVEALRERSKGLGDTLKCSFEIPFIKKDTPGFLEFVKTLHRLNPSPVFVWTPRTSACGLFEIQSILEINFRFPFDVNREGIFNLLTKNLKDEAVFDFSEEEGEQKLMIELRGESWAGQSCDEVKRAGPTNSRRGDRCQPRGHIL